MKEREEFLGVKALKLWVSDFITHWEPAQQYITITQQQQLFLFELNEFQ